MPNTTPNPNLTHPLPWLVESNKELGVAEIIGGKDNPKILNYWQDAFNAKEQESKLKQGVWKTENTPWCSGFVSAMFARCGLAKHIPEAFPMARSWEKAGTKLSRPAYGCVVTFTRNGGGHVGFVVGKDRQGHIMVLGGNQGDAVNIKPFAVARATAYRWCGTQSQPADFRYDLPILNSNGKVSTNEA